MPLKPGETEETDFSSERDIVDDDSLITGVQELDEASDPSGIPKGSVIAILGDPLSQGDLINYHLAYTRPTAYLTYLRSGEEIRRRFRSLDGFENHIDIVDRTNSSEGEINYAIEEIEQLEQNGNLIIEPANHMPDLSAQTLQHLQKSNQENEGIVYLYFTINNVDAMTDAQKRLLFVADGIFHINTIIEKNQTTTTLNMTKLRGAAERETVALDLSHKFKESDLDGI